MLKNEEDIILAEVASMYYEHDLTQNEIAKRLFFSKPKVSRLLKKAKERNIVSIKINYPLNRTLALEQELMRRFQVSTVIVIKDYPEYATDELKLKRLGEAASEYLDGVLEDGDSVGLGWGRTLYQMIKQLKPSQPKKLQIVQMMGAANDTYLAQLDSPNLVRMMAEKYQCDYNQLFAPMFVESDIVKQMLMKESIIKNVIKKGSEVKYLLTGIADIQHTNAVTWAGYLNHDQLDYLVALGAVGYICGHFIDQNGNLVKSMFENKTIGITFADLIAIPNLFVVAGGVDKTKAIAGALRGGYIHTLVTDESIATALLKYSGA